MHDSYCRIERKWSENLKNFASGGESAPSALNYYFLSRIDDTTRFILHLFAMPVKLSADTRKIYEITIVRYMLLMRIQSQMAQRIPVNFLISHNGIDSEGARRVDFLFYHPNLDNPLVIEIDGKEHESSELVDKERDNSLRSVGIKVIRIKNEEIIIRGKPGADG